jgi:Cdc6-like AAA superfamily ATPase
MSMLPSEPKIFHGRESEMSEILKLLSGETPRIAILGTGGMGKTSLARAVVHHAEISDQYTQHQYFVVCDSAANKIELAALIGAHLGLKPGKDLTQAVFQYFTTGPSNLLILDNLETVWEPMECRGDIEEFLSLLTDVRQLALVVGVNNSYVENFLMTHRLQCAEQKDLAKYTGHNPFFFLCSPWNKLLLVRH